MTMTWKDLPPDPALRVPQVRAWEAVLGPPEGPGERQGQVRALMTTDQGVHSASRPGILSLTGHLQRQLLCPSTPPPPNLQVGHLGVVIVSSS